MAVIMDQNSDNNTPYSLYDRRYIFNYIDPCKFYLAGFGEFAPTQLCFIEDKTLSTQAIESSKRYKAAANIYFYVRPSVFFDY